MEEIVIIYTHTLRFTLNSVKEFEIFARLIHFLKLLSYIKRRSVLTLPKKKARNFLY